MMALAAWGAQHDLIIETTGRYFVVISRFGQSLGSTAGDYELHMTRKGVLSERGSSLRYDDSVIGTISDSNSEVYYTFQAEQGDILTISMVRSSGTLDPYLRVVDADRFLIAENDDQVGADTRNAQIDALIIERSGTYLIVATRYDDSSGSFVLRIEEAEKQRQRQHAPGAFASRLWREQDWEPEPWAIRALLYLPGGGRRSGDHRDAARRQWRFGPDADVGGCRLSAAG